ncbi:MAG: class I SAM-dependent methyltransferase [Pleurocapsa sp. MO_192.B19]|nr:class I SAM-dependent methyltransferase [Pleurocapsa sp. MO_192.B19]
MFTGHNSQFWDKRYEESDYVYGTEANQFLTEQQHRLESGMKTLVVGDGEGRNGVWLASQGLEVLSIDLSPVGLKKAEALATQRKVKIQTQCADLTSWNWPKATYDLVVAIYVHFAPEVRQRMHRSMLEALKPGGLIILEAFNLEQLQYQIKYDSGGPKIPAMLYRPEMLQQDFAGGKILELTETITDLHEGQYHHGKASVIRLVLQQDL